MYLRLPGDNGDAILTALEALIADERTDVDGDLDATILPSFHKKQPEGE